MASRKQTAAAWALFIAAATSQLLLPLSRQGIDPQIAEHASAEQIWLAYPRYSYMVNVTVETPGQPMALAMPVSSPHTWVPDAGAQFCLEAALPDSSYPARCGWGTYNSTQSTACSEADEAYGRFFVPRADGSIVEGTSFSDRLAVHGIVTDDLSMGNVDSNTQTAIEILGLLGINDPARSGSTRNYPSFFDLVVSSRRIASPAYSMWLDAPEGATGSLLLGAIDLSRFTGPLVRLQAERPTGYPAAFSLRLGGVNASGKRLNDSGKHFLITASLNPGEAFSYLPSVLVDSIMEMAGATWDDGLKRAMIPCDAASQRLAEFEIELQGPGGPVLHVQLADLIIPRAVDLWRLNFVHGVFLGPNTCLFGAQKVDRSPTASMPPSYSIGSSLLRRAYMVFDTANDAIALAHSKLPLDSHRPSIVVAFESFGATIPSSTPFPCGEACRPWCSAAGDCTPDKATGEDRRLRTGILFPQVNASNSVDRTVAIAVAVPFGVVALAVGAVAVLLRRGGKKHEAAAATKEADSDVDGSHHAYANVSAIDCGKAAPGVLSVVPEDSRVSRLDEKNDTVAGEKPLAILAQEQAVGTLADDFAPNKQASAPS